MFEARFYRSCPVTGKELRDAEDIPHDTHWTAGDKAMYLSHHLLAEALELGCKRVAFRHEGLDDPTPTQISGTGAPSATRSLAYDWLHRSRDELLDCGVSFVQRVAVASRYSGSTTTHPAA